MPKIALAVDVAHYFYFLRTYPVQQQIIADRQNAHSRADFRTEPYDMRVVGEIIAAPLQFVQQSVSGFHAFKGYILPNFAQIGFGHF